MSTADKHSGPQDIGCLEAIEFLYSWLDGELDDEAETLAQVEHHVSHCQSCWSRTQMEKTLTRYIKKAGLKLAPDALHDRLRQLMNEFEEQ